MKSGDFIYDMKKKNTWKNLVLQNSPCINWERKKCEDMHLCLNLDSLNLKFVLETKENWREVVVFLLSCNWMDDLDIKINK